MKKGSLQNAEIIHREYGLMKMLAGGKDLKTKNVDLRILEMEPHSCTSKHFHERSESIFYLIEGKTELETLNQKLILFEGDVIVIEPNEVHILKNNTDKKCILLETMSPPFSSKDIHYSEDTPHY